MQWQHLGGGEAPLLICETHPDGRSELIHVAMMMDEQLIILRNWTFLNLADL
jgi:hypothetical protein